MELNPQIMVVGKDNSLLAEVESALARIPKVRAVTHFVGDVKKGADQARSRQPDILLVESDLELLSLRNFVEEVQNGSPKTAVAAIYHPTLFGPDVKEGDYVIAGMRAGVRDFLRRPISSLELDQFLQRTLAEQTMKVRRRGRLASFFTYKGGVGKSTLAVNTACALARRYPDRVLLIDVSVQMGICAAMLDLDPKTTIVDAVREHERLDETLLRQLAVRHSSGLHVLAAPNDALEGSMVDDDVISRVVNLSRRAYDFVIVDTFPMIDRVMLTILDLSDAAYLITESTVPVLQGTQRMLHVLDEVGIPEFRRRLVLNRYSASMGFLSPEDIAKRLGLSFDFVVPYEKDLIEAANLGRPLVLSQSRFAGFSKAIEAIADDVSVRGTPELLATPIAAGASQGGAQN
ncbi:MAG: AAA family ATPase [Candidatus Sumerlaeia bacterium]|nr:AAA family ATPase [Candidatus Sumerlaeia bacterium]